MALEKILFFGFAIAAVTAITVVATTMIEDQKEPYDTYQGEVRNIVKQTDP